MDRLKKQMEFILEIDKIKNIKRQTYISDGVTKENDAEHSWHLALMALVLSEYSAEKIDILKTVSMVLIHDIIEIDAGDTYAYDDVGNETKNERELAAADRIFNILPSDQAKYMRELWDEFEMWETAEAKFAHLLDRVQPALLNDISGGRAWREHNVTMDQITKRNPITHEASPIIWNYIKEIFDKNVKNGNIIDTKI